MVCLCWLLLIWSDCVVKENNMHFNISIVIDKVEDIVQVLYKLNRSMKERS